jgi:hypothetical protein
MGTQVLSQKLTQRSGYRLKVPVLELEDSLANCALEQEDGAYAVYGQRVVDATTAQVAFANGGSATLAKGQPYPRERLAAGGAD